MGGQVMWWQAAALVICVAAAAWANAARRESRRILESIDSMLDAAMSGTFADSTFDESLLSSVESKFASYLSSCAASARNVAAEKDRIKQLIGDISHQVKTPMSSILLYSQLLCEKELPDECSALAQRIGEQASRLGFLIAALVKTSRLESGVLKPSPSLNAVAPLLEGVVEQASAAASAKEIDIELSPTEEVAVFDPKWTGEALFNIIDNAVKYTPRGGRVAVSVAAYELFCRVDIVDSGMGISEEEQPKIFQRFYRSPSVSRSEGVGVGLYLARQIISEQGGYIKVASRLGEGAAFSVFLPRKSGNLSKV